MECLSKSRFAICNRDRDVAVIKTVEDLSVPTDVMERLECLRGLHCPGGKCWRFFSCIEYVFATVATADNSITGGDSVLKEISASLIGNTEVLNLELCDITTASEITLLDVLSCREFCVLAFGCMRAKDFSLKCNSNLHHGENATKSENSTCRSHNQEEKGRESCH